MENKNWKNETDCLVEKCISTMRDFSAGKVLTSSYVTMVHCQCSRCDVVKMSMWSVPVRVPNPKELLSLHMDISVSTNKSKHDEFKG